MSEPERDTDPLDEVLQTHEEVHPHRREHAKAAPRPDEQELARKVEVERDEVGVSDDAESSD